VYVLVLLARHGVRRGMGGTDLVGEGLAHGLLLVLVDHSQDTCDRLANNLAARPPTHHTTNE